MAKLFLMLMMVGLWSGCVKDLKVWKEVYSKDKVKEEYQYYHDPDNNRRIKNGWYNSYYKNGEYKEVGTYKADQRHGEWSFATEDGVEAKGVWKEGKKDSGEFWLNVKLDSLGLWVETDDTFLKDESEQTKDVFKGLFTYDKGLWNGPCIIFMQNGDKFAEVFFRDGTRHGRYQEFNVHGRVVDGKYKRGKRDGKWNTYHENGRIFRETNYQQGRVIGRSRKFYPNGRIYEERLYDPETNKITSFKEFYRSGQLERESTYFHDGTHSEILYRENGKIHKTRAYVDGLKEGEVHEYDENGKIKVIYNYMHGLRHGQTVYYFESGDVQTKILYVEDKMEGKSVTYHRNGQVYSEGTYVENMKEGKWVTYYESGEIQVSGNYVGDKRNGLFVGYEKIGIQSFYWEGGYSNGKQDGKWVWRNMNGVIRSESVFANGSCIQGC